MFERTNDPVHDADSYNADMENRPNKTFLAHIELKITIPINSKNGYEASEDAERLAEDLQNAISCMRTDYEIDDVEYISAWAEEVE